MSDRRVQGKGYSAARDRRIDGVAVTGVAGGQESDMPPSEPAGPREPDPLEPAHGHALDPADHRLLRGPAGSDGGMSCSCPPATPVTATPSIRRSRAAE